MRFKVVVCSSCGWARGARCESKRISCNRCGAIIKVQEARPYLSTDSEKELAEGVARVNAELQARKDGRKAPDFMDDGPLEEQGPPKARATKVLDEEAILELAEERDRFTVEEAKERLASLRLEGDPAEMEERVINAIERLRERGLVLEERHGCYRKV